MAGGKKRKKGKKVKEEEDDKMTAVDRTFYELTITDLNNKLAKIRAHVAKLEEHNEDLSEKMRQFEEDLTDVTAHLKRSVEDKNHTIDELQDHLTELAKVRDYENKTASDKIKELEIKYKAMHDQLTSEIKLLNGKLNSLEEFRIQRDDLLSKFDEREALFKEQDRKHKSAANEMELKAIVEKDQLKKLVELKLLQLSDDFTKSSQIRIAEYTKRLIRENVELTNEMHRMMLSQHKMEIDNQINQKKARELDDKFQTNEITKERLIKTCQNQIEIIEKITKQFEVLKKKYLELVHFKKIHQDAIKREICDRFTYNDMSKKLRIMNQRVEMVKIDKQKLINFHQQYEKEIIKLRNILQDIKNTIKSAIISEKEIKYDTGDDVDDDKPLKDAKRTTLLNALIQIISSYSEDTGIKPSMSKISAMKSVYRPGAAGFMPKSKAFLLDLFKREAKKIASAELISPQFQQKQSDGKITPKPRKIDQESLFDIEIGATIIFSESVDENIDDFEENLEKELLETDQLSGGSKDKEQSGKLSPNVQQQQQGEQLSGTPAEEIIENLDEDDENEDEINFFY